MENQFSEEEVLLPVAIAEEQTPHNAEHDAESEETSFEEEEDLHSEESTEDIEEAE